MTETVSDKQPLMGPKIALMGLGGTGKTYAIGTLVDWAAANGFSIAVLFTENGLETLLGYFRDHGREPPACLYWHQQTTKPLSLKALMAAADAVGRLSYKALADSTDSNRGGENNAFWKILGSCSNFIDDRTGKHLGPVDLWGDDGSRYFEDIDPNTGETIPKRLIQAQATAYAEWQRQTKKYGLTPENEFGLRRIFVMDSLTETANAAMKMQIGSRPMASPGDYGVAQNNLMNFLRLLTQGMACPFVMTAHVDRETDQVTQSAKIMIKAIGKALATEIPTLFSDVIYATREGDKFFWDTAAFGVDTKTRSLGYRSKIAPDFAQIFNVWAKRAGGGPIASLTKR